MPRATVARAESLRLEKIVDLAFEMEQPIAEAIDLVRALRLIGYGMMGPVADEDERAIVTVARAASERLANLQDTWHRMFRAARKRRKRGRR